MDFWIFEKTLRPSSTATIMVAKLSSARTISEAPLETSVPVIPIPIPISAVLSDGASLTHPPSWQQLFLHFAKLSRSEPCVQVIHAHRQSIV